MTPNVELKSKQDDGWVINAYKNRVPIYIQKAIDRGEFRLGEPQSPDQTSKTLESRGIVGIYKEKQA